jgi:hypothetical protein
MLAKRSPQLFRKQSTASTTSMASLHYDDAYVPCRSVAA